jgi:hypothetical protein
MGRSAGFGLASWRFSGTHPKIIAATMALRSDNTMNTPRQSV